MEALGFLFNRRFILAQSILAQSRDERLMSGGSQKFDQVGAPKPGGAGVDQRMKVEPFVAHHRFIQHDGNLTRFVVDGAKRRDGARLDAPDLLQEFGRAEGDPPLRADCLVNPLEVDQVSSPSTSRNRRPFLSLTNRFLVWPPGISPRKARESSTVNSGGWSMVSVSTPSAVR